MRKFLIDFINGMKFIFDTIIPKGKEQKLIYFSALFFYVIFSFLMYKKYGLMEWETNVVNYDGFMWIDHFSNLEYFAPYRAGIRHPLFTSIFLPVTLISFLLKIISGKLVLHVIFFYLLYSLITPLSFVLVYKYCSSLLKLSKIRALLITVLFSLFAHNLILSFTPETFPLSMLGLLLMIYITTDNIFNHKKIPLASNIIMFCFISGVTSSNSIKCAIIQLFQNIKPFRRKIETILKSGLTYSGLFILSIVAAYIIQIVLYGKWMMGNNTGYFIKSIHEATIEGVNLFQEFFFEPLLFHHNYNFFLIESVKPLIYYNSFPEITALIFYCLVIFSLLMTFKERIILLLLAMFSVDIFIHIVIGFGIRDTYVYCQHWFFICPLAIAFMYKKIRNAKIKTGIDILLIFFIIAFAWNNLPLLFRFLAPISLN